MEKPKDQKEILAYCISSNIVLLNQLGIKSDLAKLDDSCGVLIISNDGKEFQINYTIRSKSGGK